MGADHTLLAVIALPFLGSLISALLPRAERNAAALVGVSVSVLGAALLVSLYLPTSLGTVSRVELDWLPSLGLNLLFRLDGLSWLFAFLVLAIGALVALYARYYMAREDPVPRFFSYLLAFMGSMLGIVLSGNLVQLVLFWEMTSLFSFLLIGYWYSNQRARDGARMALIVTSTGGLCLLLGVLLVGRIVGSYDLDVVLLAADAIRASPLYLPALVLILIGAFTKSAQFPFHFWLPHAMAAPTPVSAYLHSATMVKAGIFVMIRLWPVLAGTDAWHLIVTSAGLATLLIGAWSAIFQHDLKGLLAYSTISHLGLITLLLGLGSPLGAVAAIFHTVNHATFKASLFMAAGIIDHETGTRDLRRLSGLYRFMPITATLAMVAAAAMAGVPLLNGFISKEMFLTEMLETHSGTIVDNALPYLATIATAFSVIYSVRFIHQAFFGPAPLDLPRAPREPPGWMQLPSATLVIACLIVGVVPAATMGPILGSAVRSVLGVATPEYSLAIWHGFNRPFLMSMIALGSGSLLYLVLRKALNRTSGPPVIGRLKGGRMFERFLAALIRGARALERLIATGRLQPQMRLLVVLACLAGLLPVVRMGLEFGTFPGTPLDPAFGAIWIVGGACAVGAAYRAKHHRLSSLVLMAGAGLVACISFVWLSAPDLALTQLLVETVTTVLLLLGLRWLPKRREDSWPGDQALVRVTVRRTIDLAIAVTAGTAIALVAYAIMTRPLHNSISRFFTERAYSEGGGTNVVNVMLVDFRGFDTLGEITVLAIVALTIFSLLRKFRPAPESVDSPVQQRVQSAFDLQTRDRTVGDTKRDYLLVPTVIMEWLFPVIFVFAMYLLLRGHDLPGGGFAAGVAMSLAIVLQYMASGTRLTEARLRVRPVRWVGTGLLLAALTGMGSLLFGYPFLSSHFRYVELPLFGTVPFATALLFDIGVFSLVVGATALILVAVAHQSIRTPRTRLPAKEELAPILSVAREG